MKRTIGRTGFALALCLLTLPGCGGDSSSPANGNAAGESEQAAGAARAGNQGIVPPTASISNMQTRQAPAPEPGSPDWLLAEIRRIQTEPFPNDDLEARKADRARRNQEVIKLATEIIAATHQETALAQQFSAAAQQLLEARLQLAIQGRPEDIDQLYEDAESFKRRDPQSASAAQAAYTLVRFAHTNARKIGQPDARWLKEFAQQSRMFASQFPQQEAQSLPLLRAAARSCELHAELEESQACYALILEQFPNSPLARDAAGSLRRMNLEGRRLELAGPTVDGGSVSIDDYAGRNVLIVFWSSHAAPFLEQLPQLLSVIEAHKPRGLAVIGVNLDDEEPALDAFFEQQTLDWQQMFYADPAMRGWNHPAAVYYGVHDLPTLWLVDGNGIVVKTKLTVAELDAVLNQMAR